MYVRLLTNNFLSEKAVGKSKDVHLAVLRVLPEVIRESVDADASSKSVIVYDPASGEKKMVSPTAVDGIESLGEVKTAEQREAEINARMQDTIQSGKDWLEGNVANPVGMQIQLGDGRIATIEAMHEDGKSAIATLPDGTQFLVSKDVLQRIVNNGQYADYKARRDAEASKREAEQGTESAPETATEGGQPLPEEASTKEEESREYAQGDVFDVVVDGQKMHAEIVSPKDADGRFVVNVDDGESMRTLYVTPEELAAMEYRKEPSTKAEETRIATEGSSEKALERGEQPTEEHTPTALERIPRDEKGNAQFHDVDTETAWDGLVEMSGNEETAHKVAEASLANAEKRLKAAKALKEKGETPEELLRSIKENEAAVAEAERVVDAWKAIVGEKARREEAAKAEAERIATEKTEAERKAAEERERAEAEEKTRIEAEKKEAERIAAEKAEEEARVEAERKAEEERKTKEEERKERDENGQPFVVSSDGTTTFGEITEDTGLTAAPIKLSEGVADEMGNGYGLRHIEARHGDQIRKAGFSSVKEFVKYVASNYDKHNIKIGKKRANGVETFLIQAEDEHSNVLYVELSKDGSYWNVNSGGIFRKGYAEKKKDVGQNTEHPTSATTMQDKSFVQTDKDNGSQSADTHSDKQHPSADKGTTLPADQQTSDKENTKKVADSEGENTLKAKIEAASADVNTEPTEAQKEAGNYKKGHVQVGTFDITIEQPEGSIRRGTDADGKKWESKMHNTYGYFRGTEGVDGDHIDVFLSNDIDGWNGRKVFVVDQYNPDGTFDEHKVMLGFNDMDEAKSDYLANYEKGWENGRRIDVSATNLKDFEKWIDSSHRKTKPFSEYSSVNKGSEKPEKKQEKQSVFDKAKEIADKEEKKRKAEADKPKQKPLTEAERKDAEEVAGALGYRVEWVDTMEENGTIDADKKVIRIAKDAENPLVQVLGHEVAHGVKRMDGGKFRALQKAAKEVAGEKEWNERIEKKRKLNAYAEGKLAEEVTCDIVGEALNDKDALKRLAESQRGEKGILARLRDAVARMVEYFKNRGDKESVRRMKAADRLLAEFESALKEGEGVNRSAREAEIENENVERSVRKSRSEKAESTAEERELRDNLVERMRKGGLDVVTDSEEMQRVIDTENERTRMMGVGSVREHRVYHGSGADFDAFDHSHMGDGEGAQAYGWGTYVTEVEGIGRTYAIQNTTKHNDALRALQHDVDAISDQLNRHRDDLKYDEEQLKRANEWRAEAELDYELFKDEAEELKEKYGESSPKYRNHLFNDIYTDEMKRAQSSVKSTEESIQYRKEKISELEKALKDKQAEIDELPKEFPRHLYTVEIPDDNGSNYLDWNGHPAESLLKDVGSFLESEGFERVQDSPVRYEKSESTVVLNPNATGADLYAELREALGSDKKASQALAELGCIGIKYPADNMRGGRKDGAKNYVIFNENDAKITDHVRFLRTAGGEVYGLVKDGRIYLDPKVATAETAVHEYTHLWGDMLRRKDSEQWSHTVKELKDSVLWEEVKELYPELKTDGEIADEVLSTFSGRRGAERLREEARRVADGEGGVFTKAKAIETLERVKEAIARFWEGVARMFGINRYRSAEELADMAMRDLINGVKPTSRTFTFDNFYKDTKAVFEGTERPKGKPDYTSYSGSEYWYGEDKDGKYVVRGSDHWSGEFKVKDGERTNVGRNHYSEITEDGMLPIGAQGSLKFGWEKGLSKPVGSGISAAIDRRGSGDSNNIASCYWYIDNAKEKDNKGFTYGKAYLSEFEDKERRRDIPGDDWRDIQGLEGGTRNMFVGERGATEADKAEEVSTRLDNLSVARRMEEAKKDAKTIKMATGWERGSDGKWRYETGDVKIKDTIELDGKTFKRYDEDMLWTSGKFGDVVDAPELFKAYPELRDVRIETDTILNDMPSNGEYNPRTNTITIHSDDLKYQNSILNHEIQHAIQHIEGFETGGSAENVRERIQQIIDNSSDEVGYARERLREWADLNAMAAMLDVAYRKFVGSGNEWERAKAVEIYWYAINAIEDNDKAELAINYPHDKTPREIAESGYLVDDVIRELNRLADETRREIPDGNIDTMRKVDRLVGALKDKTDFELYNRLAGEVEARNTEKRIGMTEEERRASLASETEDVAREDQILLRQGLDGIDIMQSEAAATPLKGDEALTALDSIFGENEGSAIPPKISSFAKFKNLFKKPVRTFLGELVQVKDEVWNKILRNNRQDITGTVLPTIENADFAIRDTDGSTLYVKRFKGDGQERMYNVVVVNKHGEVEDYISSVHIKRDNNLRNKIKKGAELFLPNARTTDGTMSRNNSTPGAKVANYSETAKPRFNRKPGESIFDYASRVSEDVERSVRERVSARDEYEKKVKSKGFQTKEALQNSMLGLQEFMYAIDHASGNKRYIEDIPDFENPILGENRLSSVNKEEMHQVAKTQFKPLMSAVAKLSGNGKESGELYDYMFAKHGLERDAVMRQREAQKEFDKYQKANPKGTKTIGDFVASLEGKDYAGLTALTAEDGRVKSIQSQIDTIDEQMKATDDQLLLRKLGGQKKRLKVDLLNAARDAADDIRKAFESNPSHDRSDINELWSRVNEVNGNTLRKLYESGMLTKEAYNDISSMYTNYIPMRGFDQTTSADAYAYLTHGDSAFNAPIKTAKGRSSKADNPIAYMQAMAESAIMQGNRNVLVKQKMLNFVRNHPSDLASVSDVWLQYDSVADEWKPFYAFGRESKG